jgi:TatD DNase family protein
MKLIDTHCHVNFPEFDKDAPEVIERALAENIGMINVGVDLETSEKAVALAEQVDEVYAAVGLHPNEKNASFDYELFKDLAYDKNVVAVGETGLDFYRNPQNEARVQQEGKFRNHIALASELKKTLVVHCRQAYAEALKILKPEIVGLEEAVIHSFTGSWEEAKKFLDIGVYLSFNGIITFARDYDEVVQKTPLEYIILETDAPFLTPEPHRGKRNEPLYVTFVAKQLAKLKELEFEEVVQVTTNNAKKLFKL